MRTAVNAISITMIEEYRTALLKMLTSVLTAGIMKGNFLIVKGLVKASCGLMMVAGMMVIGSKINSRVKVFLQAKMAVG